MFRICLYFILIRMGRKRVDAGGGFPAILYVFRKGWEAGGWLKLYQRMRTKNACKTCALGMGGQRGGMVNEAGRFPEVCKKSVQAQAADMAGAISESFFQATSIAQLGQMTPQMLESLGRVTFPLLAEPEDTHFRRISWDEALARTAEALQEAPPEEVFFYASGRASNEAAYLMQLVARAYGTANIHNCSFYCHQASGVALNQIYGSGTASLVLEDLEKTDLAVIVGANPASNHPRLMTMLMHLRRRGGKVITINPMKELGLVKFRVPSDPMSLLFGTKMTDVYLQPQVGSDIALLKALLKGLVEGNHLDHAFISDHTQGWESVLADVNQASWGELLEACRVPLPQIEEAVRLMAQAKRGVFLWAMGLTHHTHGVDNILALGNLALARGWLGRPGCGLLPIRGHSNVQGVGSVGVAPTVKAAFARHLEERYDIHIPAELGQDTYASMAAAHAGRIQAAFLLGGNLFASNPDRTWAGEAMRQIPLTVSVTTKLNEGHLHGRGQTSLILPALARDEEPQPTTQESMFNYVRLSEGGEPSVPGEMWSEVAIIAALAERILPEGRVDWTAFRSHRHLREEMSVVVPGYQAITQVENASEPARGEFQIEGRTFHIPTFATPDGKAHFHPTPLPEFTVQSGEFRLMTLRSEGQFNSVVYDEEDLYRGNTRRDVVMIAESDARALGVAEGSAVSVETDCGTMTARVSISEITPGSAAMYYPEANVLVPRRLDVRSKTPAFKSVAARIRPLALTTP